MKIRIFDFFGGVSVLDFEIKVKLNVGLLVSYVLVEFFNWNLVLSLSVVVFSNMVKLWIMVFF